MFAHIHMLAFYYDSMAHLKLCIFFFNNFTRWIRAILNKNGSRKQEIKSSLH